MRNWLFRIRNWGTSSRRNWGFHAYTGWLYSHGFSWNCSNGSPAIAELVRGVRAQLENLIPYGQLPSHLLMCVVYCRGLSSSHLSLGLSHSISRYRLKFSPDKVRGQCLLIGSAIVWKVDVMIIQAVALLEDLDKEINVYAMRVREWYGWHFPEMGKIVQDNIKYAQTVDTLPLLLMTCVCVSDQTDPVQRERCSY